MPDPAQLPAAGRYRLTQSEERTLPDGTPIRFDWDHQLQFAASPGGVTVVMIPVSQHCTGNSAICAGFQRLTATQTDVRQFRVGFGGNIAATTNGDRGAAHAAGNIAETSAIAANTNAPETATAHPGLPPSTDEPTDGARLMQGLVTTLRGTDGASLAAAEVRNLMMFAGRRLPAVGAPLTDGDQRLTVLSRDRDQAVIRIEQRDAANPDDGSVVVSTTDHTVNMATGLLISSVARDVLIGAGPANRDPTLLRQRTTYLAPDAPGQ